MIGTGNDTDIRITLGTSDVEIYLGDEKVYPNTPPAPDYSLMYFTTEGIYDENTVIEFSNYTSAFEYSKDGVEWHSTGTSGTVFNLGLRPGEKGYWRCTNPNIDSTNGIGHFNGTRPFKVYGNIMSLVYGDDFEGQTSLSGKDNIFETLFSDNQYLTDVENLVLPATTLENGCYSYMFSGCTSLVNAPVLPATTLTEGCYHAMFSGCTSLVNVPELPATELAQNCYHWMFGNCNQLVNAPELPATTLASGCYGNMFYNCASLVTAPELPATELASGCYSYMFSNTNIIPDCSNIDFTSETVVSSGGLRALFTGTKITDADLERILPKNANGKYCLPVTTLTSNCYASMFQNCTSLTTAPELPAETLAMHCYSTMFSGCTSLVNAPELPATTLADWCYYNMFGGCTSLVNAPELPATTLTSNCYREMFKKCSKLNYIKAMFTTTPSTSYTYNWVDGVASSGRFVKNSAATWNVTGVNGIPRGWTVETANE